MNQYKSSAELKASAKEHLFGKYGIAIAAMLIMYFCVGTVTITVFELVNVSTVIGTILYHAITFMISVLSGLFTSGITYLYLKIICERPISIGDIFYGFRMYADKALIIEGWITLLTCIGNLPLYVLSFRMNTVMDRLYISGFDTQTLTSFLSLMLPYCLCTILSSVISVILSLFYGQAFYLLHDFPQYSAKELLIMSRKLMVGSKGRLLYIYVSFLPLIFLGFLSCGVGLLWVFPYIQAAQTEFYLDLIKKRKPSDLRF